MATYTRPNDFPVNRPVLTSVLAEVVALEAEEEGRRTTAFPTLVRYSDAGKCSRYIALNSLLTEEEVGSQADTDVAGQFRMWIGKLLHEKVMEAIVEQYGGEIEVPTYLGADRGAMAGPGIALEAGHADWIGVLGHTELGKIAYELKTEGSFGFDKAVGVNRKTFSRDFPAGPRASTKIQGALNAVANDCDTLILGSIAMDAFSVGLAEKLQLSNIDRICAEWHYSRAEFMPWAQAEMARAEEIAASLNAGVLPPRTCIGDQMEPVELAPEKVQSDTGVPKQWQCAYCRCRRICVEIGPGPVRVTGVGERTGSC